MNRGFSVSKVGSAHVSKKISLLFVLLLNSAAILPQSAFAEISFRHSSSNIAQSASSIASGSVRAQVEGGNLHFVNERSEAVMAYIHDSSGNVVRSFLVPANTTSYFSAAAGFVAGSADASVRALATTAVSVISKQDTSAHISDIYAGAVQSTGEYFSGSTRTISVDSGVSAADFPEGGAISYAIGTPETINATYVAAAIHAATLIIAKASSEVLDEKFSQKLLLRALTDKALMSQLIYSGDGVSRARIMAEWVQVNATEVALGIAQDSFGVSLGGVIDDTLKKLTSLDDVLFEASIAWNIYLQTDMGPTLLFYDMSYDTETGDMASEYRFNWRGTPLNNGKEVVFHAQLNELDQAAFRWYSPVSWGSWLATKQNAEYARYEARPYSNSSPNADLILAQTTNPPLTSYPDVVIPLVGWSIGLTRYSYPNPRFTGDIFRWLTLGAKDSLQTGASVDLQNLATPETVSLITSAGTPVSDIMLSSVELGSYKYTAMARNDMITLGRQNRYWVLGQPTPVNQIPTVGSAVFHGEIYQAHSGGVDGWFNPRYVVSRYGHPTPPEEQGEIRIAVDFSNDTIRGSYALPEWDLRVSRNDTVPIYRAGTISNAQMGNGGFSADLGRNGSKFGSIDARFFGPNTTEIGGLLSVDSGVSSSVFRAKTGVSFSTIANYSGFQMRYTPWTNGLPFGSYRAGYRFEDAVEIETANAGTTPVQVGTTTTASGDTLPTTQASYGNYAYTSWGTWTNSGPGLNANDMWVIGARTPSDAMPTVGTATYTGQMNGFERSRQRSVNGTIELIADFSQDKIGGNYVLPGLSSGAIPNMDIISVGAQAGFSGDLGNPGSSISGAFYGPAAEEVGGVWSLYGIASGTFVAQQ